MKTIKRAPTKLCALALMLFCSVASAQNSVPSLVGTWNGTITGGYRAGALEHSSAEPQPKNAVGVMRTMTITKQEGSGFIGTWGSKNNKEALIGVIRADTKTVLMVDDDTNFTGTLLSADNMEMCVQEHGAARIAVCVLFKRE